MNQRKAIYISSVMVMSAVSMACLFSIYCLYKSLSGVAVRSRNSTEAVASLTLLRDRFKDPKNKSDLKFILKSIETIPSNIMQGESTTRLKNLFYKSSNDILDNNELDKIKQNLASSLFNFYRQQVVKRNMAVASALSGLISEAHTIFMKDQDYDAYLSFLKKSKDQVEYIKGISRGFTDYDQIIDRCKQVESQLLIFSNSIKQKINFEKNTENFYKEADSLVSASISEVNSKLEKNIELLQRNFIVSIFLFITSLFISVIFIRIIESKSEKLFNRKISIFSKILNNFGKNDESQHLDPDMNVILSDKSWTKLLEDVLKSETSFKNKNSAEIVLSKSITNAFIVFSSNRKAIYWNSFASRILDISGKDEVDEMSMENLFARCGLLKKKEYLNDLVNKIESNREATAFAYLKQNNDVNPFEINIYPIHTSSLKGGFVVMLRDMRGEEQRVAKRVQDNFFVIEKLVALSVDGKSQQEIDSIDISALPNSIMPLVEKLKLLRMRNKEREELWLSEILALKDKAQKERDILNKFLLEIENLKSKGNLMSDVSSRAVQVEDRLYKISHTFESLLVQANFLSQKIAEDVAAHNVLAAKTVQYEKSVRAACANIEDWHKGLKNELELIRKYKDWVRMQALNMNVGSDINSEELKDKARKFSTSVSEFYEKVSQVSEKISLFVEQHPGSLAISVFENPADVESRINKLNEVYTALEADTANWKQVYSELKILSENTKALEKNLSTHRQEIDVLTQACIQVNNSSLEGINRWV